MSPIKAIITLSSTHESLAANVCKRTNPRKKNWLAPQPVTNAVVLGAYKETTLAYKGVFKGWKGSEYTPLFCSYGMFYPEDKKLLRVCIGDKTNVLKAGRGYEWGGSNNESIYLIRTKDKVEYHIDSDDALTNFTAIRARLLALAKVRKEQAKKLKEAQPKISKSLSISYVDSLRAGNCAAGTKTFAQALNLDITKEYKVSTLLKMIKQSSIKFTEHQLERFNNVIKYCANKKSNTL